MRERNPASNPYFQSCDDVDDGDDDDHDDDGEDTDPIPTRAPTGYTLVSASRKPRRYHPQRVSSRRTDGLHPPVGGGHKGRNKRETGGNEKREQEKKKDPQNRQRRSMAEEYAFEIVPLEEEEVEEEEDDDKDDGAKGNARRIPIQATFRKTINDKEKYYTL